MTVARPATLAAIGAVLLTPLLLARGAAQQSGSPGAPADLTPAAGFEVALAAGPPLVNRPIVADFDEEGRLYVADSSGSNAKVETQLAERPHRIVRLEDRDGDGRFDRSVVFADGMMFPEGALWLDGSLYVAAPPSIWKLTDADGDGVAERREEWFEGKTLTGCANDLHGPYLGPDGWIYWTKGAFAEQTYARAGQAPLVTRAAHILRRHPRGGDVEVVMTGGIDNPVDVAFTPEGERIFTATFLEHPQQGRRDGLVHAVYGGVYGKPHGVVDGHPRTGELMPVMAHLGPAVPAGLTRYVSDAFGPEYRDNLFAAMFNLRKVTRHILVPDGATYRTRDSDFLVSTNRDFHPTDVLEDADGSLVVLDTGPWYKLCCPTSQLAKPDVLGAIYRVRRTGAPRVADPRGRNIRWRALSPARLSALLSDARPVVRARATAELRRTGPSAVPALGDVLRTSSAASARREAVWALAGIDGTAARQAVRSALADRAASVRHAAIHAAALHRDREAVASLTLTLSGGDAALQRASAEALGRIGDAKAVPALLAAAANVQGRVAEHSLTYSLIEIADPRETSAGLRAAAAGTSRAALVALDQMANGTLNSAQVAPFLASAEPQVRETAWWIAERHRSWGPATIPDFRSRLAARGDGAAEAALVQQLARFAAHEGVSDLIADTVAAGETRGRHVGLRAMAAATLRELPGSWTPALRAALESTNADDTRLALAAIRSSSLSRASGGVFQDGVLAVARDSRRAVEIRLEALAAWQSGHAAIAPLPAETFDAVRAGLAPGARQHVRSAASAVVERSKLDTGQLLEIARALATAGPLEAPRLLVPFRASTDAAVGQALVAAIAASPARATLGADTIRALLAPYPDDVRRAALPLVERIDAETGNHAQRLERTLAQLKDGDVRRGQEIFNSNKVACTSCHAIGYVGGRLGPDLTRIGEVRTERDLLEAIMFPNASFARGYEPVTVMTTTGTSVGGVLRGESGDEVLLVSADHREIRIPRQQIAELRPGSVSLMPQGLDQLITTAELSDLLAFLKATRWGAQ